MEQGEVYITHYHILGARPRREGLVEILYFMTKDRKFTKRTRFRSSRRQQFLFRHYELNNLGAKELEKPIPRKRNQEVFLDPKGRILLADRDLKENDPEIVYLGNSIDSIAARKYEIPRIPYVRPNVRTTERQ